LEVLEVRTLSEVDAVRLLRRFRSEQRRALVVAAWCAVAAAWAQGWHLTTRELGHEIFVGHSTAGVILGLLDLIEVIEVKDGGHGYRVLRLPPASWYG
jgi:hypothetical protein